MPHIRHPWLFPLSARLAISKSVLLEKAQSLEQFSPAAVALIFRACQTESIPLETDYCYRTMRAHGGVPPLEEYRGDVLRKFGRQSELMPPPGVRRAFRTAVNAALGGPICDICSRKTASSPSGHKCEWTQDSELEDEEAMEHRSECLGPLKEIFGVCEALAKRTYSLLGALTPSVGLSTGHMEIFNDQLNVAFMAETRQRGIPGGPERYVHLSFHVPSFTFDHYASLMYVIFHEYFIHGLCGIPITEESSDSSKIFHEGWMDAVAMLVLQRQLKIAHAGGLPVALASLSNNFQKSMEAVRLLRFSSQMKGDVFQYPDALVWEQGSETFTLVRWLLSLVMPSDGESVPDIDEAAIELSIKINASPDVSDRQRERFADKIYSKLWSPTEEGRADALLKNAKLRAAFEGYVCSRDAVGLVKETLAIR